MRWATDKTIDTPFVSVPGLLTAECKTNEHSTYLEIKVNGVPADPRVDDITAISERPASRAPNGACT